MCSEAVYGTKVSYRVTRRNGHCARLTMKSPVLVLCPHYYLDELVLFPFDTKCKIVHMRDYIVTLFLTKDGVSVWAMDMSFLSGNGEEQRQRQTQTQTSAEVEQQMMFTKCVLLRDRESHRFGDVVIRNQACVLFAFVTFYVGLCCDGTGFVFCICVCVCVCVCIRMIA